MNAKSRLKIDTVLQLQHEPFQCGWDLGKKYYGPMVLHHEERPVAKDTAIPVAQSDVKADAFAGAGEAATKEAVAPDVPTATAEAPGEPCREGYSHARITTRKRRTI